MRRISQPIALLFAVAIGTPANYGKLAAAEPVRPTATTRLTYEEHVRPIFRAHCFDCHGATDVRKGDLDLRLVRFLQKGGESGPAIVPGQPKKSYLIERVRKGEMPPGDHRVPDHEIDILERWIAAGAPTLRPEPETIGPGLGVSIEEREFWSFQPIRRPSGSALATYAPDRRVRTPIDALVLDAAGADASFSADADRRTLVKRAYLDVLGLPPTREELHRWLADERTDFFDHLITELLDSPHYGERWARHWLDVAGYADSEGYTEKDTERPWAWKYRDWVIRALNADKPFDEFITEQLAGDELAGSKKGELSEEQIDLLTATGFLRMAADGTGSGADNADGRNQVMADTLKIVGTSLLGMSLQCAQCHDHRYDPIPQTDYFALRAVFEPALDWKAWKVPSSRRVSLYTEADRKKAASVEAEAQKIAAERAKKQAEFMKQALEKELKKYEESLRPKLRTAKETPPAKRSKEQVALLKKYPSVDLSPGVLYQYLPQAAAELKKYDARIASTRKKKPAEEFLRALVEPPGHTPVTNLFHRGDHRSPKQAVPPASLTVAWRHDRALAFPENDPALPTTGRRLAFAKWLVHEDNPLFARVVVNRIWMHHFGRGLVATPADFGKLGAEPSHPELLDWLASEFRRSGWSLKKLHRLILSSTTWRQSCESSDASTDRATALLRKPLVRLDAETIRDRMLAATGSLDHTLFGRPLKIKEDDTGQVVVDGEQRRRSLYIQSRRSRPVAMLKAFDAPVMATNCEVRPSSTVATQSLMLLNGHFTLAQAAKLAARAAEETEKLSEVELAKLPSLVAPDSDVWEYGYGSVDEKTKRVASFRPLPHFDGERWQGGTRRPDSRLGWVQLNAVGGHPDGPGRDIIRRFRVPTDGTLAVRGELRHPGKNGDGVLARVLSSRSGLAGEWIVVRTTSATNVEGLEVQKGDTIDLVVHRRANFQSDGFDWPVTVVLRSESARTKSYSSIKGFRGPLVAQRRLPAQIVRAWELALCRSPSRDELALAIDFVRRQVETHGRQSSRLASGRSVTRQALINLCQSLLSSNEFLYVD